MVLMFKKIKSFNSLPFSVASNVQEKQRLEIILKINESSANFTKALILRSATVYVSVAQ